MLEINGFDEHFHYSAGDAVDLCMRVKKKGYRIVYYPKVTIIHKGGKSASWDKTASLMRSYEGELYYFNKHHGKTAVLVVRCILILTSFGKAAIASLLAIIRGKPYGNIARSHIWNALKLLGLK